MCIVHIIAIQNTYHSDEQKYTPEFSLCTY
nr:MAG TPA: hypothetical protein [Caudoviricetes sp.]